MNYVIIYKDEIITPINSLFMNPTNTINMAVARKYQYRLLYS